MQAETFLAVVRQKLSGKAPSTCTRTRTRTRTHTRTYAHMYMYVLVYVHMHANAHVHVYIQMQVSTRAAACRHRTMRRCGSCARPGFKERVPSLLGVVIT